MATASADAGHHGARDTRSKSNLSITCISWLPGLSNGIKLNAINIPGAVANGSSIWLNCEYILQDDELYSVKWYKDGQEFYHILMEDPMDHRKEAFALKGIYVDVSLYYSCYS